MQILIKLLQGKTLVMKIDLKEMILGKEGFPTNIQRILYNGKILSNETTLKYNGNMVTIFFNRLLQVTRKFIY